MKVADYIKIFTQALNKVNNVYYGNKDWVDSMLNGNNVFEKDPRREKLIPLLSKHHERVFCYELYHQARKIMETKQLTNQVFLQAELRKNQVTSEIEELFEIKNINGPYYPDFLIHNPLSFDDQYLIIEVKANPELNINDMVRDIKKIDEFINKYNYQKGIFLAINLSEKRLKTLLNNNEFLKEINDSISYKDKILLIFKEDANKNQKLINLNTLIENKGVSDDF